MNELIKLRDRTYARMTMVVDERRCAPLLVIAEELAALERRIVALEEGFAALEKLKAFGTRME